MTNSSNDTVSASIFLLFFTAIFKATVSKKTYLLKNEDILVSKKVEVMM